MRKNRSILDDLKSEESAVDMTPLIDIVFILLIFFIVSTVFVKDAGVTIERPQAASSQSIASESILIAITAENRIIAGGATIPLGTLRSYVSSQISANDLPVVIQSDKNCRSGLLIDVIDECKMAGAENVSVATEKENP